MSTRLPRLEELFRTTTGYTNAQSPTRDAAIAAIGSSAVRGRAT